jgi:hypothetical protein
MGVLLGETRRWAPLLGTLKDRQNRLWRWACISTGAPLGNLEGGSPIGDFERWMKGAPGMERLFLKRLSVEGSFTGDPRRYVKKGSTYRRLSP